MQKNISIIGAGRIGDAFSRIFTKQGHVVSMWDKEEGKVQGQKSISETVTHADAVFLCIPSWALRETCNAIKDAVPEKAFLIALAKGIEHDTLKTPDEIIGEFFPKKRFGMLGGPMLAEELNLGHVGIGMVGTPSAEVFEKTRELFKESVVRLIHTKDMHGVALGGILKNTYALAFGIADGLEWSGNAKGWLLVKSMNEIAHLSRVLGGRKKTVLNVAGLGDLATCGFSEYSRNRQAGQDVLEDGKFDIKSEGVVSAPSVFALVGRKVKKFEILFALKEIMAEGKNPREIFAHVLENIS